MNLARRVSVRVTGTVQGVGFRPYVYRLATSLDLDGFVLNDANGVAIEVQGTRRGVSAFLERLPCEVPPLAGVDRIAVADVPLRKPASETEPFKVVATDRRGAISALVTPDTGTCDDCFRELLDPANRRYRYPFINCTNCGPRFSIVRTVPYDRPFTTMADFAMCEQCSAEYEDPGDRRFHAQPNACPDCGPATRLLDHQANPVELPAGTDAVRAAAQLLLSGAIVAVKGLGGYHLACLAADEDAVSRLRGRKHREDRPFAIMARDLEVAQELVELDAVAERLLLSRARPIVLAKRRSDAAVASNVAPRYRELGVVLPYTPLHHVLLRDVGAPLVMTSGNRSSEPIAYLDADALERLGGIADWFLAHDRPIETRVDDSIARVVEIAGERRPMMLRRSRGYVPAPISVPVHVNASILGVGGHLKNTFCILRGDRAFIGPHIGDLENLETLDSFNTGIQHLAHICGTEPAVIAHDLHPDYLSSAYARDREAEGCARLVAIQHHHAHMAACLAEHGCTEPAVGVIFDGTGFGTDGTVWGGEILVGDLATFERVGSLWPVRMPGGAAAIREPWRMACAWLGELGEDETAAIPANLREHVSPERWSAVARLARSGLASPVTTSVGRLLDAISALCGVCARASYEGQAAIELEMCADAQITERYPVNVVSDCSHLTLDPRGMLREIVADLQNGRALDQIASLVHNGLSYAAAEGGLLAAAKYGVQTIILSGGVFQNVLLLERTAAYIAGAGCRVLTPQLVPPNDGGLSFGQAVIAAAREHIRDAGDPRPTTSIPAINQCV